MKKVLNAQYNKIEFITVYDNITLVNELVNKYEKKFSRYDIGISYTKEPTTINQDDTIIEALKICINIDIPLLKHEGWIYIGSIEKVPTLDENNETIGYGNFLQSLNQDLGIDKYASVEKLECNHCNTKHNRKIVHIFRHEDGKEFMVGTACSKEYFGIDIHKKLCDILNLFPKITDFAEDCEGKLGFGSFGKGDINKGIVVKLAYGIIKEQKRFVSKSSTDEFSSEVPTSTQVEILYQSQEKDAREYRENILEYLKDKDILELVRDYWFNKDDDNHFTHNVKIALRMLNPKLGFLVYAVWEYMKEVEDITGYKAFGNKVKNSNYVGTVGEKIKGLDVEIYSIASSESMYGITFIISMIDNTDNVIVWKTSSPVGEKGEKRVIKTAIIKEHATYKEIKQTVVKNLKFVE